MTTGTSVIIGVAIVLPLALPLAALAQSGDAAYCKALTDKYRRYVSTESMRNPGHGNAAVETAVAKCESNPAESIPVLEGALKGAKIDLPPRS